MCVHAYLQACSGLADTRADHAVACVEMALEMLALVRTSSIVVRIGAFAPFTNLASRFFGSRFARSDFLFRKLCAQIFVRFFA